MAKPCLTEFAAQRRHLLESSLVALLAEKSFQEISVKDICCQADIPRRTFYHYDGLISVCHIRCPDGHGQYAPEF